MAEETHNARHSASRGIVYTCLATGLCGFAYLLALLFCIDDIEGVLHTATGSAAVEVFVRSCGQTCGATLAWIIVVNLWFSGVSSVSVTGRITFALARDGAFPGSSWIATVNKRFLSPFNAIVMVFVFDACLLLLPLNDKAGTAFESIIGEWHRSVQPVA
jgi:amino acid transporter